MALVRLKRNWFGPNGVRYKRRDGLVQIPDGEVALLPSDAEVFDDHGKALPSKAAEPLPGYGAKPLHEQNLDLIPGAAPVHQINTATSAGAPPPLSEEDEKKRLEAAKKASDERASAAREGGVAKHEEEEAAIQHGIDVVTRLKEEQTKANDPVEAAALKAAESPKAPVKEPEKKDEDEDEEKEEETVTRTPTPTPTTAPKPAGTTPAPATPTKK